MAFHLYMSAMSSLLSGFAQSLRDALRDVVLIVVSIVIAFGVDAWWDKRGDRSQERAHLEVLLTEFSGSRAALTRELETIRQSERATRQILELVAVGPDGSATGDSLGRLINTSFNVGGPSFAGGALEALLSSGDLSLVRDTRLSAALAGWPLVNDRILESSRLLTRNREEEITDYLVDAGAPISRVARHLEWLELPESPFELDPVRLLSDPAFESLFVSRAARSRFLEDAYRAGLREAARIIEMLEAYVSGPDVT